MLLLQPQSSGACRRFRACAEVHPHSCSCRYLRSLVETILIYQQFNKPGAEQPAPKQELVDFWMDFLVEATKRDVSSVRFPVSWGWGGGQVYVEPGWLMASVCPPGVDFGTYQNLPTLVSVHQQRRGGQHGLHLARCP